jgi:uncharacterized membrane protein
MKKLTLSLAALLVMLACSSASAAVVRVGPVRVVTRPVARARYVAPAYRPAVRATVRSRRATGRQIIHDHRVDRLQAIQDALWP